MGAFTIEQHLNHLLTMGDNKHVHGYMRCLFKTYTYSVVSASLLYKEVQKHQACLIIEQKGVD